MSVPSRPFWFSLCVKFDEDAGTAASWWGGWVFSSWSLLVSCTYNSILLHSHTSLVLSSRNNERMTCGYSQFYDNGTWFDFIHFHKSETFSAGESFLGFVVLEFKENSCSCKRETWRVKSPSWFISLFLSGRSCQVRTGVRTFGKFFEMFLDFHVHTEMNVRVFFLRGHRRVLNWIQIYSVHIWRATQVWTFKNSFYRIKHDMTLRISTFNTEGDVRINALPCVLQTDLLYG